MTAEELMQHFSMAAHIENGSFVEKHYESKTPGRAESGAIYYYVSPDEITQFHVIDCDEYWCYTKGSPLDVWMISAEGRLTVHRLGVEADCEPLLYVPRGAIFASKHSSPVSEGTFLTCITVPRFSYEGFTMFSEAEMRDRFPETAAFFG